MNATRHSQCITKFERSYVMENAKHHITDSPSLCREDIKDKRFVVQKQNDELSPDFLTKRRFLVDWFSSGLGSIIIHLVFLFLVLFFISTDKTGTLVGERRTDEVGIVLSNDQTSINSEILTDEQEEIKNVSNSNTIANKTEELNSVVTSLLPSNEIGVTNETGGASSLSDVESFSGQAHNSRVSGQTVGFGDIRGVGKSFVYILDRSDSMSWNGGAPMRRLINDSVNSVNCLNPQMGAKKFQIVAYNHDVIVFEEASGLINITDSSKIRAIRFLRSLVATGGTNPEKALEVGIKMRPDVIFFLTDADEELSNHSLMTIKQLREQYKVKQICVVEFGKASTPKKRSFRQLAGENNGTYTFKNIESL